MYIVGRPLGRSNDSRRKLEDEHIFKTREANQLRDVRRNAIRFGGYQVAYRNGHVQVRIDDETYQLLKSYYVDLAVRRNKEFMIEQFYRFPFEPYAPIRRQAFNILREVNRVRKQMGDELLPSSSIWLKRRIVKPFEPRFVGEPSVSIRSI